MGVKQLINNRGNAAANQFVIETKNATYFQSYNSVIAKIDKDSKLTVSSDWDYSKTTMKHLNIFLADYGYSGLVGAKNMRKAIEEGKVKYVETLTLD